MSNGLTSKIVAKFLFSIAAISILGFVFLITFFIGYLQDIPSVFVFGSLNDIFGSLEALLTAILATFVLAIQGKRWLWLNGIGVVLTWIGAFIVTLDSLMAGGIISMASAVILSVKYGFPTLLTMHDLHFGYGLIGAWLLILNFQAIQTKSWPARLIGLGFSTGILMMIGLLGFPAALGFVFLYPIWCILLGRSIWRSVIVVA